MDSQHRPISYHRAGPLQAAGAFIAATSVSLLSGAPPTRKQGPESHQGSGAKWTQDPAPRLGQDAASFVSFPPGSALGHTAFPFPPTATPAFLHLHLDQFLPILQDQLPAPGAPHPLAFSTPTFHSLTSFDLPTGFPARPLRASEHPESGPHSCLVLCFLPGTTSLALNSCSVKRWRSKRTDRPQDLPVLGPQPGLRKCLTPGLSSQKRNHLPLMKSPFGETPEKAGAWIQGQTSNQTQLDPLSLSSI